MTVTESLKCSPPYVDYEKTLLHVAQFGNLSTLNERWFYDCRIIDGSTMRNLLHLAATNGHTHFLRKAYKNITERCGVIHQDLQRYFLNLVMAHDKWGNTALDLAALGGHLETVNYLVELMKDNPDFVNSLIVKVGQQLSNQTMDFSQRYLADNANISELAQQLINLTTAYMRVINYLNGVYEPKTFDKYR